MKTCASLMASVLLTTGVSCATSKAQEIHDDEAVATWVQRAETHRESIEDRDEIAIVDRLRALLGGTQSMTVSRSSSEARLPVAVFVLFPLQSNLNARCDHQFPSHVRLQNGHRPRKPSSLHT